MSTHTHHAKSWTRRKRARPGEILEAAMAVFAEKGFAASRMEDIAARAGVTKGTIYLYFPSKEEVFKTLVRDFIGSTLADVARQAAAYDGSVREFLTMFFTMAGEIIREGKRTVFPKIIISESGNFPELARFYREEVIDTAMGLMAGVIARGMERGELRKMPVPDVIRLVAAPLVMGIIWRTTFAQFDSEPVDYERLFATHVDVLLRGLAPEGKPS
jgi:AcrR family transcriptional regulator